MRKAHLLLIVVLAVGCAAEPPAPPPPPPPPLPPVVPMPPAEKLDVQGYSRPIAGGRQSVEISVNGKRVINASLSAKTPHGIFHANYEGHEIAADCTLAARVNCSISLDGMPQAQAGGEGS